MEFVIDLKIVIFLIGVLGFGSSLIHYSAFARAKARADIKKHEESI